MTLVDGNVGIGTSPSAILHTDVTDIAQNSTAEVGRFQGTVTGALTNTHLQMTSSVSGSTVANRWFDLSAFDHNPTARALSLQKSGGNVGIGTTSPGSNLEVVGTSGKLELDADNAGLRITRTDANDCYQQFYCYGTNIYVGY